jgi:F-type H+-transporting ATPase subunit alpha
LVEILKQPQYEPMPVQKQIAMIFAGTNGYLDEYDPRALAEYEKQYLSHLETNHPEVLNEIAERKLISDELEAKMKSILDNFKSIFTPPQVSIV